MSETQPETTTPLAEQTCIACRGNIPALNPETYSRLLAQLNNWQVVEQHHLMRDYKFKDFMSALAFANEAGRIAEEQGHHPEITIGWGHAQVTIWTHKINGLTNSDFILAAKLDQI